MILLITITNLVHLTKTKLNNAVRQVNNRIRVSKQIYMLMDVEKILQGKKRMNSEL